MTLANTTVNSLKIIRVVIPVVFNELIRMECMYWYNTTLFDVRGIYSIYCIRYSYMFRRLTMAIFMLYMKYLVSSYTKHVAVPYAVYYLHISTIK